MKLCDKGGYEIHVPTSGGKAGTGHNLTSTIQVRHDGLIVKQIRFSMTAESSRRKAVQKAKDWINANPLQPKFPAIDPEYSEGGEYVLGWVWVKGDDEEEDEDE
jgi:hypothetical protein